MTNHRRVTEFFADMPEEWVKKFLSRVVVADDGCWHWGYDRRGHYAMVGIPGAGAVGAHRVSNVIFGGRDLGDPDRECVHHLCGNKSCINPIHLRQMSRSAHTRAHQDAA